MCKSTTSTTQEIGIKKQALKGTRRLSWTTLLACVGAVLIFGTPLLISELIGGWVRKYTSPYQGGVSFSTNEIGDLTGKVAIVTGSNTGIGYHTALELARNGAEVIVAARSITKANDAIQKMEDEINGDKKNSLNAAEQRPQSKIRFLQLDLSSLKSVKNFAKEFEKLNLPLDILVLNAGVMKSPGALFIGKELNYGFEVTEDGFEYHIGINHVSHFYLTNLLMNKLISSAPSRVVSVSSLAESGAYEGDGIRFSSWKPEKKRNQKQIEVPADYEDGVAYGQSKLANILFTKGLAEKLKEHNVTSYSCHPGVIETELGRYMEKHNEGELKKNGSKFQKFTSDLMQNFFATSMFSAADGALTQLHLATAPVDTLHSGGYYTPVGRYEKNGPLHPQGTNETLITMLWEETEEMIKNAKF